MMKSGDKIPTLAGTMAILPYANEHPCFGQRQGWCNNKATWRMESKHLILHFCDNCKNRPDPFKEETDHWTKLEERTWDSFRRKDKSIDLKAVWLMLHPEVKDHKTPALKHCELAEAYQPIKSRQVAASILATADYVHMMWLIG